MRQERLSATTVDVGDEIGPLLRQPDMEQVVAYLSTWGMTEPSRFTDEQEARSVGLAGPVVPGNLNLAFLSQMLTDWAGAGSLRRLEVNYRGFVSHGDALTCRGVVTEKRQTEKGVELDCDVFIENQRGERPVSGTALIILPQDA